MSLRLSFCCWLAMATLATGGLCAQQPAPLPGLPNEPEAGDVTPGWPHGSGLRPPQPSDDDHLRRGGLLLIGGGLSDDNTAVYEAFIQLAGGRGQARLGVLTAASFPYAWDEAAQGAEAARQRRNSRTNGDYYAELLRRYGAASARWLPLDVSLWQNAADPALVAELETLTGLFVGGGDQSRILATLLDFAPDGSRRDSPWLAALRRRLASGELVLAGTSAGAAVVSGPAMFVGGGSDDALAGRIEVMGADHYLALRQPPLGRDRGSEDEAPPTFQYDPLGGLGLTELVVDTHFDTRERLGRLLWLCRTVQAAGVGLPEDTALWLGDQAPPGQRARLFGQGAVFYLAVPEAEAGEMRTAGRGFWLLDDWRWPPPAATGELTGKALYAIWRAAALPGPWSWQGPVWAGHRLQMAGRGLGGGFLLTLLPPAPLDAPTAPGPKP